MANLNEHPWHNLLRVLPEEVKTNLILTKESKIRDNLFVRFYTLPSIGGKINEAGFIKFLLSSIEGYVFDKHEISECIEDGVNPLERALTYFGDVDPIRDGRYGELILYILTEGILKVPLVVHKIAQSYNANKQVEGSDGLFVGNHYDKFSLLIGESKMRNIFSVCLPDAINSIDRFHINQQALTHEINVARKHLSKDIDNLDHDALKQLYDSFRVSKPEFNQFQLAHPILLVYKEKEIANITVDMEKAIIGLIDKSSKSRENSIEKLSSHFPDKIILDFFLIPVADVNGFRVELYKGFHGGKEYVKKNDTE